MKQGFSLTTTDFGGNIIAQSGNNLQLSNLMSIPTTITTPTYSFGTNIVTTLTGFTISFTYPIPTELNCYIEIIFPSDISNAISILY